MTYRDGTAGDSLSKFYDSMGAGYEQIFGSCQGRIDFVKEALSLLAPDASVLDIGCGTGQPVAKMVIESGRPLIGIDFSPGMISVCRERMPRGTFKQVNLLEYQPEAQSDAAIAAFSLLSFSHQETKAIITKIAGWLKPGGYFFIGTLDPEPYEQVPGLRSADDTEGARRVRKMFLGDSIVMLLYTEAEWNQMLKDAGFEVLKESRTVFVPPAESGCDPEIQYYIIARLSGRAR